MPQKTSSTTFGIDDDGDFADLFETVEDVFGITWDFDQDGIPETYGDLEASVLEKLADQLGTRCLLRHALRRLAHAEGLVQLKPTTKLSDILNGRSVRRFLRELRNRSGLNLSGWVWRSRLDPVDPGIAVLGAMAITVVAAALWGLAGFTLAFGLSVIAIISLTQIVFRSDVVTVADLVRASHGSNYASLAEAHGPGSKSDVIIALQSLCREISVYSGPTRADTTLLRERP